MRRFLDSLYSVTAYLAALCMIGVLLMVVSGVVTRQIGVHIPGTDAYAGYLMAAAGFFALASTFKHGEHIRVTLILNSLKPAGHRRLDLFALVVGILLALSLAYFSCKLVMDSLTYNDISTGNDATPLWIPQLSMAVGAVIFLIAIVDEFVRRLMGHAAPVSSQQHE
ncbi:TRAP transporter small permease [Schauerella aestuarii]|uniref:TRAP transporter small permease n=1 Tax=Schauerella aestuarii TaxID=2511204 RepID=UPI0013715E59|nr:TRAP transporter small permease [Achromobacter aestuarii]MYZ42426.1 TRAP transporter small permease [Achromobacter aestuarii]